MSLENDDELEAGLDPETGERTSVSDKSESELEGKPTGAPDDDDEGEGDAGRESGDPAKEVVGLKKRIAKLTAQRNRSRVAEQERDALAARVAAYEAREREREGRRRARREATPEYQNLQAKRDAVRQTIDDTYGRGTSDYLENYQAERQQRDEEKRLQQEKYANDGISYLRSELEDHDIPVDDETLVRYERAVGSELAEDPELLAAYLRPATQKDALQAAFERVRDGIVNPMLKKRGAKEIERIERTRGAVLGGGRERSAVAEAEEPTFDLKPPKGLTPRQQEAWWAKQTQSYWDKLNSAEA